MAFPYDVLSWLIRGRYKISLPTVSDGGTPELAMDAQGRPRVVVDSMPGSGSSAYTHYNLTTPNSKGTIKASSGALRQVVINNDHTSELWVCLFNKASTPGPSDLGLIMFKIHIAAKETVSLPLVADVAFSTGIAWFTFSDVDMTTEGAAKIKINALHT